MFKIVIFNSLAGSKGFLKRIFKKNSRQSFKKLVFFIAQELPEADEDDDDNDDYCQDNCHDEPPEPSRTSIRYDLLLVKFHNNLEI